ncbi:Lrp/AsnC family transcriptional regulator [Glaciibacter psychrotolerans]|uniref:Lrp/AsnC family transcriptional regulator for asnA, asnC and gidA n=1 Tax=Glaciibacter psychrotolerans TaxID=670054 RepID=A0A7Z0J757_9MICO|nr:Lrp/AsnC family transcriptional regulator [Leifsonia psychrotolerans]NYJ20931.1 Lrp/AsnC family transcriptional regulator for asnA, asnC and gidA [Leifsonia psychrotolerans]
MSPQRVDALDYSIVKLYTDEPGISVVEAAKRLGVARPTVQARLNRMHETGVITRFEPTLDAAALGFPVTAICHVEIDQDLGHATALEWLQQIPEILDMYTTSGDSDIVLRIVARSNRDLQRVFDTMMRTKVVKRTRSSIVLTTQFENRILPVFEVAAADSASAASAPAKRPLR